VPLSPSSIIWYRSKRRGGNGSHRRRNRVGRVRQVLHGFWGV